MTTSRTIALVMAAVVAASAARAATNPGAAPTAAAKTGVTTKRAATATPKRAPVAAPKHVAAPSAAVTKPAPAPEDSTMTLRGGTEGTVFRSLTVEGEDRIHYEVERPQLKLEMDPSKASGLEWGSARDVLDRTVPDEMAPLLAASARAESPYTARPWLSHFASGSVATFRPAVQGVDHWKLTVANGRGEPVTSFSGHGEAPKEIAWDGRASNGAPVTPGMTYSYVFEAVDRAGNHRHFVGEGFRVAAFRIENESATTLVFTGAEMSGETGAGVSGETSPLMLEAASWLNQSASPAAPITVTATGRSNDEATSLGQRISSQLSTLVMGDAARIRVETRLESDAPPGGAASITTGRMPATAVRAKR